MKNKSEKQVENINNSNEKLLLSDVIKSVCEHKNGSRIVFGERRCVKCGTLFGRIQQTVL